MLQGNCQGGLKRSVLIQPDKAIENERVYALGRGSFSGSPWPLARVNRSKTFAHFNAKRAAKMRNCGIACAYNRQEDSEHADRGSRAHRSLKGEGAISRIRMKYTALHSSLSRDCARLLSTQSLRHAGPSQG